MSYYGYQDPTQLNGPVVTKKHKIKPDKGASLLITGKPKGKGGSSCHQCKSRRNFNALTYCTSNLDKKNKKCRKKFCGHCLKKFYKVSAAVCVSCMLSDGVCGHSFGQCPAFICFPDIVLTCEGGAHIVRLLWWSSGPDNSTAHAA